MGLWCFSAVERMDGDVQCLEPRAGGPLVPPLLVSYCFGAALGPEEAIGLDWTLGITVSVRCLDSGRRQRPVKEKEAGGKLGTEMKANSGHLP